MKKVLVATLTALGLTAPASAAVITLEGVTSVSDGFRFNYQGTLGPDEGVTNGSRLVIFDFAGYVDGSIFAPGSVSTNVENTTDVGGFILPGFSDDPNVTNLVFTYTGPDFRTVDGPFAPFDFNGLGAVSVFDASRFDGFTTFTIKNNPDASENTLLIQVGQAEVPVASAIPEPATWAMMLGGFGLLGAAMRRRPVKHVTA